MISQNFFPEAESVPYPTAVTAWLMGWLQVGSEYTPGTEELNQQQDIMVMVFTRLVEGEGLAGGVDADGDGPEGGDGVHEGRLVVGGGGAVAVVGGSPVLLVVATGLVVVGLVWVACLSGDS